MYHIFKENCLLGWNGLLNDLQMDTLVNVCGVCSLFSNNATPTEAFKHSVRELLTSYSRAELVWCAYISREHFLIPRCRRFIPCAYIIIPQLCDSRIATTSSIATRSRISSEWCSKSALTYKLSGILSSDAKFAPHSTSTLQSPAQNACNS